MFSLPPLGGEQCGVEGVDTPFPSCHNLNPEQLLPLSQHEVVQSESIDSNLWLYVPNTLAHISAQL